MTSVVAAHSGQTVTKDPVQLDLFIPRPYGYEFKVILAVHDELSHYLEALKAA